MAQKPDKTTGKALRKRKAGVKKQTIDAGKAKKKEQMLVVLKGKDLTREKFDAALKLLAKRGKPKGADLRRFVGKVKIPGDAVEIIREMRRDHR